MKHEADFLAVAERSPETVIKRLTALAQMVSGQTYSSPLALMKLRGELTDAQFAAAFWFICLHADYQRTLGVKGIGTSSGEAVAKAEPPDPFSEAGLSIAKREARVKREYDAAVLACMGAGADYYQAFKAVALDDLEPSYGSRVAVMRVSEALRLHRAGASRHRRGRRK